MKEQQLKQIIGNYLEGPFSSFDELDLIEEFAFLSVDHKFNLTMDSYAYQDYIIKSDTFRYVHHFLSLLNENYVEEFDYALKNKKMTFLNQKKKTIEKPSNYEVVASYSLKDSFELLHQFFLYWIQKNAVLSRNSEFFLDTFAILAEFLFQDYLESLDLKSPEIYYAKMNRFIHTNVFTLHMIVELKLIELYQKKQELSPAFWLEQKNILKRELLAKNCDIIIDDILSFNTISLPFHKRYLFGLVFASFIHQKIMKRPKLIQMFCYLIDHPEDITVEEFMEAIGISMEERDGKKVLSSIEYQELKQCFLLELEDTLLRINMNQKSR